MIFYKFKAVKYMIKDDEDKFHTLFDIFKKLNFIEFEFVLCFT